MNNRKSFYDVSSFYNKKAILKCSFKGMRYQVQGVSKEDDEKVLQADVWPEPFCYEKTPLDFHTVKEFEYSEDGLDKVYGWKSTRQSKTDGTYVVKVLCPITIAS